MTRVPQRRKPHSLWLDRPRARRGSKQRLRSKPRLHFGRRGKAILVYRMLPTLHHLHGQRLKVRRDLREMLARPSLTVVGEMK